MYTRFFCSVIFFVRLLSPLLYRLPWSQVRWSSHHSLLFSSFTSVAASRREQITSVRNKLVQRHGRTGCCCLPAFCAWWFLDDRFLCRRTGDRYSSLGTAWRTFRPLFTGSCMAFFQLPAFKVGPLLLAGLFFPGGYVLFVGAFFLLEFSEWWLFHISVLLFSTVAGKDTK